MKNEIILTNRKWFNTYSVLRILTVILTVSIFVIPIFYESVVSIVLKSTGLSLVITILLFDYFQKPSFLEACKENSGIIIKQYAPDTRYLFFLTKNKINTIQLNEADEMHIQLYKGLMPLLNQIEFRIKKIGQPEIRSKKINIGWIQDDQLDKLNSII